MPLGPLMPEDEGTMILCNIGNHLPNSTVSHLRRFIAQYLTYGAAGTGPNKEK